MMLTVTSQTTVSDPEASLSFIGGAVGGIAGSLLPLNPLDPHTTGSGVDYKAIQESCQSASSAKVSAGGITTPATATASRDHTDRGK